MTVADFITRLKNAELELETESLLDALWLSQQTSTLIFDFEASVAPQPSMNEGEQEEKRSPSNKRDQNVASDDDSEMQQPSRSIQSQTGVYSDASRNLGERRGKASPVAIPAANPLAGRLALSRTLRPFRQRWPSRQNFEIDEDSTVERTAELNHYLYPVFRPRLDRWFDVSVIVEDEPAVAVWNDTLYFFSQMLKDTGAFQDVRIWYLRYAKPASSEPRNSEPFLETPAGARSSAHVLAGGTRRLLFFATHGSSERWVNGSYMPLFRSWTAHCSVVLLHLLPRRLWKRTPLGEPNGYCHTGEPGVPNSRLVGERFWWGLSSDDDGTSPIALPCIPISTTEMESWSRMQMGRGNRSSAFLLNPAEHHTFAKQFKPESSEDYERLISIFRTEAPTAFQLATYLSSGPFTLSVARLVQEARFGATDHAQLAEVLLSGLVLARYPDDSSWDPSTITYEFHPEARRILLRSLRWEDAKSIAQELEKWVSRHIEQIHNRQITFRALVPDRNGKYDLPEWAQPFAVLGTSLLRIAPVSPRVPELVNHFLAVNRPSLVRAASRLARMYGDGALDKSTQAVDLHAALFADHMISEEADGSWRFTEGVLEPLRQRVLFGIRILWVDDRPQNTIAEQRRLAGLGAQFKSVLTTEEAISAISENSYDLVISDMGRGKGQPEAGLDLLDKLRKSGNVIPFIIYTAAWADTGRQRALQAGAFGCTRDASELIDLVLLAVAETDEARTQREITFANKVARAPDPIANLKILLNLTNKKDNLRRIAWSQNLRYLASAGFDGVVQVWDLLNKAPYRSLRGHSGVVYGVCWSPDSAKLASSSGDGSVRVWDLKSGLLEREFRGKADAVLGLAWSPVGNLLATSTNNGSVQIWNVDTGKEIGGDFRHKGPVHSVSWSPSGERLASASNDGTVCIWTLAPQPRQVHKLLHGGQVYGVSYSPDGQYLASCGASRSIRIWRHTGKARSELVGHTGHVTDLSYSADGKYLGSVSWDNTVRIWNVKERRLLRSIPAPSAQRFHAGVSFSPYDGGHAIAFTTNQASAIQVWQPDTERDIVFDVPARIDTKQPTVRSGMPNEVLDPSHDFLKVLKEMGIGNQEALALWKEGPEFVSNAVLNSAADQQLALDRILIVIKVFASSSWSQLFLMTSTQELIAVSDLVDEDLKSYRYQIASLYGVIGRAATSREPVWVPNVSQDKMYIPAVAATRSEFAVPLCTSDVVLGVVNLEFKVVDSLSQFQRAWLTRFCEPLARRIAAKDGVVFINKVHDEEEPGETLARDLHKAGASTWSYSEQWRRYGDYSQSARAAIDNSGTVIVVISKSWLTSDLAPQFAEFRMQHSSLPRVVCVVVDESSVPAEFEEFPVVNFTQDEPKAFNSLLQILRLSTSRISEDVGREAEIQEALRRIWHPSKDFQRRGPLKPCKFKINPHYLTRGANRWAKWADVLVNLEDAPNRDYVYLIPSRFSPDRLSDPGILTQSPYDLEQKRVLTDKFLRTSIDKRLDGFMFNKVMAAGTQATHVYSQAYDDFLIGHSFMASAFAIAGEVKEPVRQRIRKTVFTSLAPDGGSFEQDMREFRISSLLTFDSAHTQVAGSKTAEVWRTSALSTIEGLNLFDVITADRVVLRISIECPRDRTRPANISFLGTRVENLRIGGMTVDITLESQPLLQDQLPANLERIEDVVGLPLFADILEITDKNAPRYSLVRNMRSDQSIKLSRNMLEIPGLGTLLLGELTVIGNSYEVVMIRFLGSDGTFLAGVSCLASTGLPKSEQKGEPSQSRKPNRPKPKRR